MEAPFLRGVYSDLLAKHDFLSPKDKFLAHGRLMAGSNSLILEDGLDLIDHKVKPWVKQITSTFKKLLLSINKAVLMLGL